MRGALDDGCDLPLVQRPVADLLTGADLQRDVLAGTGDLAALVRAGWR